MLICCDSRGEAKDRTLRTASNLNCSVFMVSPNSAILSRACLFSMSMSVRAFAQKPRASLRLIDPVFEKARGRYIAGIVTKRVGGMHPDG
jgi:hypothetical protein